MVEQLEQAGHSSLDLARERERLRLKRARILKQHREGYISDKELQMNMAAVDLALANLAVPEADGVRLDTIIEAGGAITRHRCVMAYCFPRRTARDGGLIVGARGLLL
jgi:hypothetical protein